MPLRDLIACVSASMKLLSINVSLYLQCRKSALCPHLDPKYHTLAGPSNRITSFLFGDNLEQKVSDIFKIAQAVQSNRFQAVRGRSRLQHRSFRPHRKFQKNFQYQNQGNQFSQYSRQSRGRGGSRRQFGGASGFCGGCMCSNRFRPNFRRYQGPPHT